MACWRQVGRFEVAGFSSPGKVTSASRNFTVPVGTLWEEKVGDGWARGKMGSLGSYEGLEILDSPVDFFLEGLGCMQ